MEPTEKDVVTVPKSQLESILEQNRELIEQNRQNRELQNELLARLDQNANGGPKVYDEDKKKTFVRVAFVNGKAFTGYVNRGSDMRPVYVYEKSNPLNPNKRDSFVDIKLEDGTTVPGMSYIEFLRESEKVECEVVDVKETPWSIDQGLVPRRIETGGQFVETDTMVPVRIKGVSRTFVVKVPNRPDTIEIDEQYVNIA